jgi:hypothetical protein
MQGVTEYRIHADGTIVHQDDFTEYDNMQPFFDDYEVVAVPDVLINFIEENVA